MKSAKSRWTLGEKSLFLAPLLIAVGAVALKFGPAAGRRWLGTPYILRTAPSNLLRIVALSPDGRTLAASGWPDGAPNPTAGTMYLWDARTLEELPSVAPSVSPDSSGRMRASSYHGIIFSPDGKQWGYSDRQFSLYDFESRRRLWKSGFWGQQADFSPDGTRVALSNQGEVTILDAKNGQLLHRWKNQRESRSTLVRWSPNSQLLACISRITGRNDIGPGRGGKVELHDRDGKKLRELGSDFTAAFDFSPDGKSMVCIGEVFNSGDYSSGGISNVFFVRCFSVDDDSLMWERISGGSNQKVDTYRDVCFAPDGQRVAVQAAESHQVLLLDAANGQEIQRFSIRPAEDSSMLLPHSLAFSPDGKRLFARGRETVLVWDLNGE